MSYRILGALMILAGCGGVAANLAHSHCMEERALRQVINCLDLMTSELAFRLTPLPQLCRMCAQESTGAVSQVFARLAAGLDNKQAASVSSGMLAAVDGVKDLPPMSRSCLLQLGSGLGRFDLEGQRRGLESSAVHCRKVLEELTSQRKEKLKNYQTLALCAGAALAILFI